MTAAEARTHIRYSGWASRKALDAALALPAEDQTKPMGVSHESILGTLGHIYLADRIWYKRTVEPELSMPSWNDKVPLEALTGEWQELQRRWEAWAEAQTDDDMDRVVVFRMLNGTHAEALASACRAASGEPRDAASRAGGGDAAAARREAAGDGFDFLPAGTGDSRRGLRTRVKLLRAAARRPQR